MSNGSVEIKGYPTSQIESQKNVSFDSDHQPPTNETKSLSDKNKRNKGFLKHRMGSNSSNTINQDIDCTSSKCIQPNNFDFTFTIYIRAVKGNNEKLEFTQLQCINLLLQSLQAADSDTKIVLAENDKHQRLHFKRIDTNRNTNTNYQRLENCLKFANTDMIEGNLVITSMAPYHVIKK
jgi:hypothetical protein